MGKLAILLLGLMGLLGLPGTLLAEPGPVTSVGPVQNGTFPWVGEELFYSVRINGAEAMRAGIRSGEVRTRERGGSYVAISGMAQSRGFFNAIYPLDDRANTYLNPINFFPLRSEKVFDEAGKRRTYFVDYRQQRFEARVERERDDRLTRFTTPIPGSTHDMLTWIYALRGERNLAVGDQFSFYIYDGWLVSRLDLEVVGAEDLLTPMGWFKTWRVSFSREIMNVSGGGEDSNGQRRPPNVSLRESGRHTGNLWFSRDENLLPVRATISTMLGSGEAVLIRYQPGSEG